MFKIITLETVVVCRYCDSLHTMSDVIWKTFLHDIQYQPDMNETERNNKCNYYQSSILEKLNNLVTALTCNEHERATIFNESCYLGCPKCTRKGHFMEMFCLYDDDGIAFVPVRKAVKDICVSEKRYIKRRRDRKYVFNIR